MPLADMRVTALSPDPLAERLPRLRYSDVGTHGKLRDVDPEFESRRKDGPERLVAVEFPRSCADHHRLSHRARVGCRPDRCIR